VVKLVAAGVVIGASYACRRTLALRSSIRIALLSLATLYTLSAVSGVISHDADTTPILCMVVAVGAAALLPWGLRAQLLNILLAGLATMGNLYVVHGGMVAAFGYPAVAVGLALPMSLYIAYHFDQHRRTLAERELEHQRAQHELQQSEAALQAQSEQLRQEAEVSAALVRVGSELISSLSTPVLLERLCRVTTEVLHCDASHTLLLEPDAQAFVAVSGYGDTPEQVEAMRLSRFPARALTALHDHLRADGIAQVGVADCSGRLPPAMLDSYGLTAALVVALRREGEIIGVHTASYRGRTQRFSPQQERIAVGIGQLASFALENARLVEQLERVSHFRSDFIATMSHELRTPLNVIMGYQELLADGEFGDLTAAQLVPLRRAQMSARELLDLVSATLDLSRLEAGPIPLLLQDVAVGKLLEDVAAETQVPSDKPEVAMIWCPPAQPLALSTDLLKLRMVLKNLIGNAIKFTDRGRVTVAARARDGGVEFSVSDTGIGIPEEARTLIFEPFRQADSSSTRRHGGAGLGLYIVRRLLDRLGGTITVESAVGRGATFRVWLPAHAPAETADDSTRVEATAPSMC
jgi:signal transduction histidine kinase